MKAIPIPPLAALLAAVLVAATPLVARADTIRQFGGVTVSCSDAHQCTAAVKARGNDNSVFVLTRAPDWRARWVVSLSTAGTLVDRNRAVSLSVDNGVDITLQSGADYDAFVHPNDYYILSSDALARLMLQIQRGHVLRFGYIDVSGGPHTVSFPLDGLPQALTEIDSQQGHVGGDRRGGPPSGLPPAPEVDAATTISAEGTPPLVAALHDASGECEAADGPGLKDVAPLIGALSDTATLYALPCFKADAGTAFRLYMVERGEIGGIHRQFFALYSNRLGWTGTDTLYGVGYDAARHGLTATAVDDTGCRLAGSWSWQESGFRLDALSRAADCPAGGRAGDQLLPPG